ncbi:MAG TPA: hypothetical protein VLJ86_06010 [Ramlibacter sp.]|nr:hypothetical protein [Ramlibacter sp.]
MASINATRRLPALARTLVSAFRAPQRAGAFGGAPELASIVARRVAAIAFDDPQRARKAFRVFLESLLLRELGEALVHDAGFTQMVDAVDAQMRADAEMATAANALGAALARSCG